MIAIWFPSDPHWPGHAPTDGSIHPTVGPPTRIPFVICDTAHGGVVTRVTSVGQGQTVIELSGGKFSYSALRLFQAFW